MCCFRKRSAECKLEGHTCSPSKSEATVKEINMPKTAAVIMAAGKGTRMKSSHAKASFKVALTPMIKLVADTARSC